jgi:hypothetical protein
LTHEIREFVCISTAEAPQFVSTRRETSATLRQAHDLAALSRPNSTALRGSCIRAAIRIRTDGKFAYREELVDDVAGLLDENTRVGAVEALCEFTQAMLPALAKAVEHPT